MLKWKKIDESHRDGGEYTITYGADGCRFLVQSRRVAVPHSNRSGSWLHTTYFTIDKLSGDEKEYYSLRRAQNAVEEDWRC